MNYTVDFLLKECPYDSMDWDLCYTRYRSILDYYSLAKTISVNRYFNLNIAFNQYLIMVDCWNVRILDKDADKLKSYSWTNVIK